MSAAPTSADEPPLAALLGAGWREAEWRWERLQEQAADFNAAGDAAEAARSWAEALRLARAQFETNDPRLAASLTNHALALRRAGDAEAARALLDEAMLIWDASGSWIEAMGEDRRARSSTFHLRLESKHKGGYEHLWRMRYLALAALGRDATLAHKGGAPTDQRPDEAPDDRLGRWRKDRPERFSDARKLMAAALLIAPV